MRYLGLIGAAAATALLAGCSAAVEPSASTTSTIAPPAQEPAVDAALVELERRFDATLGVFAIDTGTGEELAFNADERFGFASTHKALSAAAVLDATTDQELAADVAIDPDALVSYSPITEQRAGGTMSLAEIADAAVRFSDNTAANLLLERLGGPEGFEAALRGIGDDVTSSDRWETELNDVALDDERDTSTPRALATSLRAFAVDEALEPGDRDTLQGWLIGNTTGDALIRAGAPTGWTIGDKTSSASYGTRNDIAVAWPEEGGAPIVLAVLSKRAAAAAEHDDELIAEAARIVFAELA